MKRMLARSAVWHTSCRRRLPVWNSMNMASHAAILEEMEASEASEKITMRWQRWQAHETMVLIAAKKQQALRSVESTDVAVIKLKKTRNKWKEIEAICREKGIDRSAQQCQARWFRLISAFTQIRSWEETRQPGQPSFWSLAVDERKTMGFLPSLDRKTYDAMDELYNRKVHAIEDASIKDEDEEEVLGHGSKKHFPQGNDGKKVNVNKNYLNCSAVQGCTSEGESANTGDLGNIKSVHEVKSSELLEVGAKELTLIIKEDKGSMNSGNESIEDQSQQMTSSSKGDFRHAVFTPEWECTIKEDFGSVKSVHQVHEAESAKVLEVVDNEPESTFKDHRGSAVKLGNRGLKDPKQEIITSSKALWHAGSTSKQESTIRGDFWIDGSVCAAKTAELLDEAAKEMDFTVKDGKRSEMKSGNVRLGDPSWEITTSTKVSDFQHAGSTSEQESIGKGVSWSNQSAHEAKRGKLLEVASEELKYTLKDEKGSRIIEYQNQEITSRSSAGEFQHAVSTLETIKGDFESVESVHEVKRAEVLDIATKEMELTIIDDRGVPVISETGCIEDPRGEINSSIKGGGLQPAGSTYEQESTINGDCASVESMQDAKIAEALEVAAKEPEVTIKDERGSPIKAGTGIKVDQSREIVSSSKTDEDVFLVISGAIGNMLRSATKTVRKYFNL